MKFKLHTLKTASEQSLPLLEATKKSFGLLPNLHGILAESPAAMQAYNALHQSFMSTSLDATEKTVVWQSINVEHKCHYCVPAHTGVANMMDVDQAVTTALRDESPLPSAKLEVLRDTTLALVRNRGHLSEEQLQAFTDAGYESQQLLEIIVGLAQKVVSNYVNHLAKTPVDPAFEEFAWTPVSDR
ncbi:MAG: carboxymuconolactone decarboxylase family protein [Nannocystaceae bacterium]|nr:carboxymuconolactone decarboxylase family protein [Nannocystaceae bacterium]